MSTLRACLDELMAEHGNPPLSDEQWDTVMRQTHLRVAENTTLCERGSGVTGIAGHWLSDDPSEVGCLDCLEWMHA